MGDDAMDSTSLQDKIQGVHPFGVAVKSDRNSIMLDFLNRPLPDLAIFCYSLNVLGFRFGDGLSVSRVGVRGVTTI
jgi:hypothetical protein